MWKVTGIKCQIQLSYGQERESSDWRSVTGCPLVNNYVLNLHRAQRMERDV